MLCPKCGGNLGICGHHEFEVGDVVELTEEGKVSTYYDGGKMYRPLIGMKLVIEKIDHSGRPDPEYFFCFSNCVDKSCGGHYIEDHENRKAKIRMFKRVTQ
jgi:hypothetical protein